MSLPDSDAPQPASSRESSSAEDASGTLYVRAAPTSLVGILRKLGPGLIVAGSIVGSGELIATTATGAKAGFWLLWLILIGCVIKVFVQVEFGRYAIASGKSTMTALAEVPGPRIRRRGNWLIWYWFAMFVASIAQLGGIVGGVGQALSISAPLTPYGREYNAYAEAETESRFLYAQMRREDELADRGGFRWTKEDSYRAYRQKLDILQLQRKAWRSRAVLEASSSERWRIAPLPSWSDEELFEAHPAAMRWWKFTANYASQPGFYSLLLLLEIEAEIDRLDGAYPAEEAAEFIDEAGLVSSADWFPIFGLSDSEAAELTEAYRELRSSRAPEPYDDEIWAGLIAIVTAVILYFGRFSLIQSFSTALVASFTAITIANLVLLQLDPTWGVSWGEFVRGLQFRLPPAEGSGQTQAIAMALQTFGIIGVGATELIVYPYWCLEKGYARYVGPVDGSEAWAERARGWLRVMKWDAWGSMVVYTFATGAFYLLGAAILGRSNLQPAGSEMVRYLAVMYEPVFGTVAQLLFLFGAFAVLYSTYFVANASHARVFADAVRVLGVARDEPQAYEQRVKWLSFLFPLLCFVIYVLFPKPTQLVLFSGLMQAVMLPMLAAAALYFRYRRCDRRLLPSRVWDVCLWLSAVGMLIAGLWAGWSKIAELAGW